MKKLWIIILVVVVLLAVVGFLYDQGYFEGITWQPLAMVLAAVAGPFQFIKQKLTSGNSEKRIQESLEEYNRIKEQELQEIAENEQKIRDSEDRLRQLRQQELEMQERMVELQKENEQIDAEVDSMEVDELREGLGKAFG